MTQNNRHAGALRSRLQFQMRTPGDDGMGGQGMFGPYQTQFTVWAALAPLRGGENVMGSRLSGRQPYIITVRSSSQTRMVTTDWQIVDDRDSSRVFAVSAPPTDPDGMRAWLEILATEGVVS